MVMRSAPPSSPLPITYRTLAVTSRSRGGTPCVPAGRAFADRQRDAGLPPVPGAEAEAPAGRWLRLEVSGRDQGGGPRHPRSDGLCGPAVRAHPQQRSDDMPEVPHVESEQRPVERAARAVLAHQSDAVEVAAQRPPQPVRGEVVDVVIGDHGPAALDHRMVGCGQQELPARKETGGKAGEETVRLRLLDVLDDLEGRDDVEAPAQITRAQGVVGAIL